MTRVLFQAERKSRYGPCFLLFSGICVYMFPVERACNTLGCVTTVAYKLGTCNDQKCNVLNSTKQWASLQSTWIINHFGLLFPRSLKFAKYSHTLWILKPAFAKCGISDKALLEYIPWNGTDAALILGTLLYQWEHLTFHQPQCLRTR